MYMTSSKPCISKYNCLKSGSKTNRNQNMGTRYMNYIFLPIGFDQLTVLNCRAIKIAVVQLCSADFTSPSCRTFGNHDQS